MELLLWLLGFSLPFERLGAISFGGVAGLTIRASQLLFIVILAIWFLAGAAKKSLTARPFPIGWPLLLYLAIGLLSLINASSLGRGLQVWLFTALTILAAVAMVNAITNQQRLSQFISGLFWGALIVCLLGLWQFAGDLAGLSSSFTGLRDIYTKAVFGFPRVQAASLEPLLFANYLLLPLGLGLAMLIKKEFIINKNLCYLVVALGIINFILTMSRGGYLGLLAGGGVLLIFYHREILSWPKLKIWLTAGAIIIFALTGFFRWTTIGQKNWVDVSRHFTDLFEDASSAHRWITYNTAWQAVQEKPFLGIGLGNFGEYFGRDQGQAGWQVVNNQYLEVLTETGVLGFAALAIMAIILHFTTRQGLRQTQSSLINTIIVGQLAALIGIAVQYNFFSTLYVTHIWVLIGLLIATTNLKIKSLKI